MRRVLVAAAILSSVGFAQGPARAEPPTHEVHITKNNTVTLPPLPICPVAGASSDDLAYSEEFHLLSTATTFHLTDTITGTVTVRAPGGEVLATGHFVRTITTQGPGFPTQTFTSLLNWTVHTTDGSLVKAHLVDHFTVTPDGDTVVTFERVDCS